MIGAALLLVFAVLIAIAARLASRRRAKTKLLREADRDARERDAARPSRIQDLIFGPRR
jgi:hypothetical protein